MSLHGAVGEQAVRVVHVYFYQSLPSYLHFWEDQFLTRYHRRTMTCLLQGWQGMTVRQL